MDRDRRQPSAKPAKELAGKPRDEGIVERALAAAQAQVPAGTWARLSRREQTHAIYREMRRIDLEETRRRTRKPPKRDPAAE